MAPRSRMIRRTQAAESVARRGAGSCRPPRARAGWLRAAAVALGLSAGLALPARAWAQPAASTRPEPSASVPGELPLAPLPKLADVKLPPASPGAVQSLDARLSQLVGTKASDPVEAKLDLGFLTADPDPALVSAIAARLEEMRERFDGKKAVDVLREARELGKRALKKHKRKGSDDEEGDWLQFLLALGKRDSEVWQGSVELYGMLRVLEAVGTTPAARLMIETFSYFGELVRIDLQRAFARLKDRAVPALIEAKQHDAKKVSRWARQELDALGRAIPGEAVQTTDPEVLADVLRAFGRVRDVEALGPILSFCNSERIALRQAAREAVSAVGKPAEWELESAYESLTGQKAPKDWTWDRTARELFRLYDKSRLDHVYKLMDEGVAAQGAERWADAVAAFDKVLAFLPLFERRAEMAPAYHGRAEQLLLEDKRAEALELYRKGLRLSPAGAQAPRTEARIAFLEAKALAEAGTPDVALLRRALELDPDYAPPRALLASLDEKTVAREERSLRTLYALGVGLTALVALVLL
ncbi:MAG: hypothetical protein HY908_16150, partial [Myxococcales bacterium]|nr:hypothetical protein [Myxococcales bacterium]